MQLGTDVGLGPGDIVLGGDPARSPHGKRHSSSPLFGPLCSDTVPISATTEFLFTRAVVLSLFDPCTLFHQSTLCQNVIRRSSKTVSLKGAFEIL